MRFIIRKAFVDEKKMLSVISSSKFTKSRDYSKFVQRSSPVCHIFLHKVRKYRQELRNGFEASIYYSLLPVHQLSIYFKDSILVFNHKILFRYRTSKWCMATLSYHCSKTKTVSYKFIIFIIYKILVKNDLFILNRNTIKKSLITMFLFSQNVYL